MRRNRTQYVADFETNNDVDNCRIWAYAIINMKGDYYRTGNNISQFIRMVSMLRNPVIYFHNLKFDSEFIIHYLLLSGYTYVKEQQELEDMTFNTLKTDTGVIYSVQYKAGANLITFYDSFKILPMSVKAMAKTFHLDTLKGEIDYNLVREENHIMSDEEADYIFNDVDIVRQCLTFMFDNDLKGMTLASMCMNDYKNSIQKKNFKRWYPEIDDDFCRQSYKGGFTYAEPRHQNQDINEGLVYDVNSLYPYVMRYKLLPYGKPKWFDGKPEIVPESRYQLYIVKITCSFELKPDHIPTLQMKNNLLFVSTEYLTSSNNYDVELTLTSVDLELFFKHYNVYGLNYHGGYYFKGSKLLFNDYIDKWSEVKINATKEGNKGMRTLAKLMLNSLYGKFGLNPKSVLKEPYLNDKSIVKWFDYDAKPRKAIYVALASFVTSYARKQSIEAAQINYDRFLYCDTDSIHLIGLEEPDNINIHDTDLGAWKLEYRFTKGRFIRAKTYIEILEDGSQHIACAGMPADLHKQVTYDNFKPGLTLNGKLRPKKVAGGVVLEETTFKIKE